MLIFRVIYVLIKLFNKIMHHYKNLLTLRRKLIFLEFSPLLKRDIKERVSYLLNAIIFSFESKGNDELKYWFHIVRKDGPSIFFLERLYFFPDFVQSLSALDLHGGSSSADWLLLTEHKLCMMWCSETTYTLPLLFPLLQGEEHSYHWLTFYNCLLYFF